MGNEVNWTIVNGTIVIKIQGNQNQNATIFIQEYTFENIVYKISTIILSSEFVNYAIRVCGGVVPAVDLPIFSACKIICCPLITL